MNRNRGMTVIELLCSLAVVFLIFGILFMVFSGPLMGAGAWGPTNTIQATVTSKHVDTAGEAGSHYMVITDSGTFEVQNGYFLGMYNADELYGNIEVGKKYSFTTEGNKVVNFWLQEYPYITKAIEIQTTNNP